MEPLPLRRWLAISLVLMLALLLGTAVILATQPFPTMGTRNCPVPDAAGSMPPTAPSYCRP